MISLYCVGIHFRQDKIVFMPDLKSYVKDASGNLNQTGPLTFMSGASILQQAADKFGLRYKIADSSIYPQPQHVQYLSYTPTPANDPKPRVTLGGSLGIGSNFPFYGQPLSHLEVLAPIGQPSQVIQYTVQWSSTFAGPFPTATPVTLNNSGILDPNFPSPTKKDAAFGSNGFPDNCEIRFRLLSIYCTS